MDIAQFIDRNKKGGLPLFGKEGREIWYGGPKDNSLNNVHRVWDDIEYYTSFADKEPG